MTEFRSIALGFYLLILLGLTGCATPSVNYKDFTKKGSSDFDGYSKFVLQASAIRARISLPDDNPADKPDPAAGTRIAIKLESIPTPFSAARYGMKDSGSDLWVKTEVKLKTRDNTDLFEKLEIELFDFRKETIIAAGQLVGAVVGFAPEPAGDIQAQSDAAILVFDLISSMTEAKPDAFNLELKPETTNPKYQNWRANLYIGNVSNDAILRNQFVPEKHEKLFFYSACRDILVELFDENKNTRARGSFKIADPNYVQTIAFPRKGVITATSECGVSVTSEAKTVDKDTVLLNELIKQVKAVLDVRKKKE